MELRDRNTTEEAAEYLRTPAATLRYWRMKGMGPKSFKVGRRVLYSRESLETFLAEAMANG